MSVSLPWADRPVAAYATEDRVLRVAGTDARAWLNSVLTADLRVPSPDAVRYALLLEAGGGILSDAWVMDEGADRLALAVPAARASAFHAALERYHVRENLELAIADVHVYCVFGAARTSWLAAAPASVLVRTGARLGVESTEVWVSAGEPGAVAWLEAAIASAGGPWIAEDAWERARVRRGVPRAGVDFDASTSPHEAGLVSAAVSLTKGCFVGQERVGREQRRGGVARRLVHLEIDGAAAVPVGTPVRGTEGQVLGTLTSVASGERSVWALGRVDAGAAQEGAAMVVEGRTAHARAVLGAPRPGGSVG